MWILACLARWPAVVNIFPQILHLYFLGFLVAFCVVLLAAADALLFSGRDGTGEVESDDDWL